MSAIDVGILVCAAFILYPYAVYPILVALWAMARPRPILRGGHGPRSVSFVVCAHNEQANIERRLRELLALLSRHDAPGEVIVVSDGSTDDTAAVVRQYTKDTVRLLELSDRVGKAEALSRGAGMARFDVLVFADVRQTWQDDALTRLVENFADPSVGAVSGELVITDDNGSLSGVGLYWRYEKWIRRNESAAGSQVGVTGAISACRRELFRAIPTGTMLDDVYWPVRVALEGRRVIHDARAVARDRLPSKARDEFRRKVRTLSGNFQLAQLLPQLLIPWRNPLWFAFVSHKLARLVVPWALLALPVFTLLGNGPAHLSLSVAQALGYLLALVAIRTGRGGKVGSAAASFVVLNAAAWVAFWVWASGRTASSWGKVVYHVPSPGPALRQTESVGR